MSQLLKENRRKQSPHAMITHLKNWAMQANCIGFENACQFHGSILTDMEDGLYYWLYRDALTEEKFSITH
jgi:hypothetical protein